MVSTKSFLFTLACLAWMSNGASLLVGCTRSERAEVEQDRLVSGVNDRVTCNVRFLLRFSI